MEENKKRIEVLRDGGLQCDNSECDYTNMDIHTDDYKEWIDAPCPKCGENLLTEDDFLRSLALRETIDMINSMSQESFDMFMEIMPASTKKEFIDSGFFKDAEGIETIDESVDDVEITVSTHKEVKAIKIKKVEDKKK